MIIIENVIRVVTAVMLKVDDLIGGQTEDECVLFADFLNDLDICAVHCTDCRCAVQHELHVTCSGSFLGSRGNLLGNICRSEDDLAVGNLIVLNEDDLQLVLKCRIIIDRIRYGVDQLDDQLGNLVTRGSLRTEDECSRIELHIRILEQSVTQVHNMQNVEKLSLVLMQTLYLYIENRIRVNIDAVMLLNVLGETLLIAELDAEELLLSSLVIHIKLQSGDRRQICHPLFSCMLRYPVCEKRIAVEEETSLGDAVCLIIELLRHHLIKVFQYVCLQDLCMKRSNAVYGVTADDGKVCHADLSVVDDTHIADLVVYVIRIFLADLVFKSAVDLLCDLIYTRKQAGEEVDRPFLKRFCHDRMVRVSTASRCDIPCFVPLHAVLVHKKTHKLRYSYRRMRVVHLESSLLRQVLKRAVMSHMLCERFLKRCRYEEVLLLQTKLLTCIVVVVRVKDLCDRAGKILLLDSLVIMAFIK